MHVRAGRHRLFVQTLSVPGGQQQHWNIMRHAPGRAKPHAVQRCNLANGAPHSPIKAHRCVSTRSGGLVWCSWHGRVSTPTRYYLPKPRGSNYPRANSLGSTFCGRHRSCRAGGGDAEWLRQLRLLRQFAVRACPTVATVAGVASSGRAQAQPLHCYTLGSTTRLHISHQVNRSLTSASSNVVQWLRNSGRCTQAGHTARHGARSAR